MSGKAERQALSDVALGKTAPDLVLANARVVNTITRELMDADIAIKNGRIAAISAPGEGGWLECATEDLGGRYVSPGFIDPHVHVEASMITVREYSRAAVSHGTTMIAADPHEIGNVLGVRGMRLMFDEAAEVPMKMVLRVPARIPAMPEWLETSGAHLSVADTEDLLNWPEAACLAGDINPNLIIRQDEEQFDKIDLTIARGMTVSGQSPGLRGARLNAFIVGGPEDNHVAGNIDEVMENTRTGMRSVLAWRPKHRLDREHFRELAAIVREKALDTRFFQFCTDDVYPHELVDDGHLDCRLRMMIEEGMEPLTAYQICTQNVAEGLRIDRDYGSVTPGKFADLVIVSDLEAVSIDAVMIDGAFCFRDGTYNAPDTGFRYPDWARNTMRTGGEVSPDELKLRVGHNAEKTKVWAIMTTSPKSAAEFVLPTENGYVMPDPEQGVSSVAVVDRHRESRHIGRGFMGGVHVKRGAIACTVSHDAHNLMVVGANHDDMAQAANEVIRLGGGYAMVRDGKVIFDLALPVAGLMSEESLEEVAAKTRILERMLIEELGCPPIPRVLLKLNGFSLANIPNFGFTDFGLIDASDMSIRDTVIEPVGRFELEDHDDGHAC